jgi:enoyl-[acyl-carrier-protein] reductase (NADH)
MSKITMEVLCRHMAYHLRDEEININCLRSRNALTDAVDEIFGPQYVEFMRKYAGDEYFMLPDEIGNAALALCSGMLDAMNGQVIQVDKGMAFADTLSRSLEERERLGL